MFKNRINKEQVKLKEEVNNGAILSYKVVEGNDDIVVSFHGPENTKYEDDVYTVKFVFPSEYPFRSAQGYFIGQAPNHPFYSFDNDDNMQLKRKTNLANTDFGITYNKMPNLYVVDFVKLIQ
ncbi:Ubiquitin-conjugating enzyme E2 [Orpheovirus IHUMI-LCC2]|uniref:E2 ubiquitin-conjugating enzyme n=1 Tax=Orpheovirus IHUMI-LCC2 TaxID=2023057 RepID=A0A2I2L339_9VIRU|nr:Ubiquitin-conjugating enzyme E2 [Orpheovirus IHUMI-LCC2]SNW61941.1 Ubiquitin-conjugating enzyme E2 [Orpheovirus IHUMI-LCC2]